MTNTKTEVVHWTKTENVRFQGTTRQTSLSQQTEISRTPFIQAKNETNRMTGILDLFVLSFIAEMKTKDEINTKVMDLEIRDRIITDKASLTRMRETSKPMVVETIISKTHSATIPIAKVNHVVIVEDQITFQADAKHASIANASDISAVIARRLEPIR